MKAKLTLFAFLEFLFPQTAHATGGLLCKTAGSEQIEISLGFGHVSSAGLFLARLSEGGEEIPVRATQWWMREGELRLAMVSENELREEAILIAKWNEEAQAHVGSIWLSGRVFMGARCYRSFLHSSSPARLASLFEARIWFRRRCTKMPSLL